MPVNHLNLGGQFKVDVYNKSGELLRTSNYIDNFITNSGTLYPYYFAFADCFRYLSLGTGTGVNSTGSGVYPATTGLMSGVSGFQYLDSGFYTTGGFLAAGCGNYANPASNTISLIRQWGLPDITGDIFNSTYNFKEIMVSPGRPYVSGYTDLSYTTLTGLCICSEIAYSLAEDGSHVTGKDCSQIASYYSLLQGLPEQINNQYGSSAGTRTRLKLCDASAAFARITGNFSVNSGDVMTVTYQLNITFNTGIQTGIYTGIPHPPDANWSTLGFVSNITNPGIKLIIDSTMAQNNQTISAPNNNWRLQQYDYVYGSFTTSNLYGESFIPSLGIPLEPSCIYDIGGSFSAYVSDDNTQFLVSTTGGECPTGLYKPWNTAGKTLPQNSGILPFNILVSGNSTSGAYYQNSNYWYQNPYNIRSSTSSVEYPNTGDVSTSSTPTPKVYSGVQSRSYFSSGYRGGSITTSYQFPQFYINLGIGAIQYVRSYILGYIDPVTITTTYSVGPNADYINVVPFFDCLLSGLSGSGYFIPTIQTGGSNNSPTTKIINSSSLEYNYLTGQGGSLFPIFNSILTWTAACPSGVIGC